MTSEKARQNKVQMAYSTWRLWQGQHRSIIQEKSGVTVRHIGPVSRFSKKMGAATKAFYPLKTSKNPFLQPLSSQLSPYSSQSLPSKTGWHHPWSCCSYHTVLESMGPMGWSRKIKDLPSTLHTKKKIRSVKFNRLKVYTVKLTLIGGKSLGIDLWDKLLWRFLSRIKPLLPVDNFRGWSFSKPAIQQRTTVHTVHHTSYFGTQFTIFTIFTPQRKPVHQGLWRRLQPNKCNSIPSKSSHFRWIQETPEVRDVERPWSCGAFLLGEHEADWTLLDLAFCLWETSLCVVYVQFIPIPSSSHLEKLRKGCLVCLLIC